MKSKLNIINLPCFPCPHKSICCSWGTDLTEKESKLIISKYGNEKVILTPEGYRTKVINDKCVFLKDNLCLLHDTEEYPSCCKGFPWRNQEDDGPYEPDITICPELK